VSRLSLSWFFQRLRLPLRLALSRRTANSLEVANLSCALHKKWLLGHHRFPSVAKHARRREVQDRRSTGYGLDFLIRDRDGIYGVEVKQCLASLGIEEVLIASGRHGQVHDSFTQAALANLAHLSPSQHINATKTELIVDRLIDVNIKI
jgi:hypothetical protein